MHALLTCRPAVHRGFFGRLAGSHPCTQPPPAYFKSSLSWKRCGGDVCFPQNSSLASFTSSPFSVDQPGPGPRDRLLLLCLLSHTTLPLHPLWGWLRLPGHWFSGLEAVSVLHVVICPATVPAGICIIGPSPSLPGEGATGGPGAWFHSLAPSSFPCHVFSHWQSQAFLSPGHPRTSQFPPIPPVTRRTLEPLWKLLLYPFSGSHPPASLARVLKKRQRFLEGRPRLLAPSPCKSGVWGEADAPDLSG